uniref:Glutathione peroxidase n=1 Tax=Plectus sambesii TaxID=2011161 RepID=A0A914W189_9BILA
MRLASPILIFLFATACGAQSDNDDEHFVECNDYHSTGSVHSFEVETLTGERRNLTHYAGKVLLMMNVATFCGYTQQYLDFNDLISRNPGAQIVAFPCNQFLLQEPAKNREILNGLKYVRPGNNWSPNNDVHILGKLEVNGANESPLYTFLKKSCKPTVDIVGQKSNMFWDPIKSTDVTWNFEKFLVDKHGRPRYRFHPAAWQQGKLVEKYIKSLLTED